MASTNAGSLTVTRGTVLYIGALLGPGLLLLPGLAAAKAGPASILAWIALLVVSGLLAVVFAALGIARPSAAGVRAYVDAGLGPRAGRAIAWCFLSGIITGAPIVCVIGGNYLAELLGGGTGIAAAAAAVLLLLVVAVTLGGVRTSATVQLGLVGLLVAVVVVAVVGAGAHAKTGNWTPFAPHGWPAIGSAAAVLMLSFVGWEAIAPLTARLPHPRRQLPRIIAIAFAVTSLIYLALAAVTVAALGEGADTPVPLASLLRIAIGPAGGAVAAVAAVLLTLGTTNAYLTGAATLARSLTRRRAGRTPPPDTLPAWLLGVILVSGGVLIGLVAANTVTAAALVTVPTTFFLVVYLGCTAAACRLLFRRTRIVAALAFAAVLAVLVFSGYALIPVAVVAFLTGAPRPRPDRAGRRRRWPVRDPGTRRAAWPPSSGHRTRARAVRRR